MPLSDSKLRNIKAPYEGKTELADRDGLTVRITPNAIITFNYRFRWRGKQQRIKVGRYPDIKLADARIKACQYRQVLQEGLDLRSYATGNQEGQLSGKLCCDFMEKEALIELSPKTIALIRIIL